jgi:arginine-tRNA-protein transferase
LDTTKFQPTKSQKQVVTKLERALSGNVASKKQQQQRRKQPIKIKDEMLQEIQKETWQCLRNIVPVEQQSLLSPELCRFKVKPNKDSTCITLVCMACPALDGKSKGVLKRNELARQLVTALQALDNLSVSILSFSMHESSGQVFVTIPRNDDALFVDDDTNEMSVSSLHPTNPVQEWLQTQKEPPYQLTITTLPAHESSLQPDVHKLYFAYQQAIHGDLDPLQKEYSDDDDDDDDEDWGDASLDYIESCKKMMANEYSNPRDAVKMNAAFSGFYRFLVESPLAFDGTHGTVHQHYRIDGKLIAVGVVDILPNGLSSVYAIYDPSQHVTAFGKYMSLCEIQYAMPRFYYLGFYIESCPKMRYKAEYHPSELLCPTWLKWVDAAKAQEILKKESPQRHCCTLYKEENGGRDENGKEQRQASTTNIVNQLRLDVGASTLVTLKMLQGSGQAIVQPILESFVEEMGPELSRQFILKLV